MQVSVTAKHIAAASTFPYTSPVALAVGGGAIANHVAVYVKGERFELPAIAKRLIKKNRSILEGNNGTAN